MFDVVFGAIKELSDGLRRHRFTVYRLDAVAGQFVVCLHQYGMNSTYFGSLAEFAEANVPLARVAPKYFGLSLEEAKRRAPAQGLPRRVFRLGG